jgi:hypothetical protein
MATKEQKARDAGINIDTHRSDFRTTCPACSPNRRKKRDPCLHVTIESDAIVYHCHHCQEFKGAFHDDHERQRQTGTPGRAYAGERRPRWW